MHPFITRYNQVSIPKLKENRSYESEYAVPRVSKVSVNVGVGDTLANSKAIEVISTMVATITGQKPVEAKARKAISGFKIRQGMVVGLKTTLRGTRMHDFLAKLSQVALPRTRDFRGLVPTAITADGNLNIGIRDSMIFPELAQGEPGHGVQVTIVSSARTQEEARTLYESLGFVFQKAEDVAPKKKRGKRGNYNKRS